MARDMSDKEILKMELEQLRKEVNITRTPIGENVQETIEYVEGLLADDPLVRGVTEAQNPYKPEKGGCIIT